MGLRRLLCTVLLLWTSYTVNCGVIRYRDEYQCNWMPECYYTMENPGVCNIWYPRQVCGFVKVPYDDLTPIVPTPTSKPLPVYSAEEFISGETVVDHSKKGVVDMSEIEMNARYLESLLNDNKIQTKSRFNAEGSDKSIPNYKAAVIDANHIDPSLFGSYNDVNTYYDDSYWEDDNDEYYDNNFTDGAAINLDEYDENDDAVSSDGNDPDSDQTYYKSIEVIYKGINDSKGDYIDSKEDDDTNSQSDKDSVLETNDISDFDVSNRFGSVDELDNDINSLDIYEPSYKKGDDVNYLLANNKEDGQDVLVDESVDGSNDLLNKGNLVEANDLTDNKQPEKQDDDKKPPGIVDFRRKFIDAPIFCQDGWKIDATGKCRQQWG